MGYLTTLRNKILAKIVCAVEGLLSQDTDDSLAKNTVLDDETIKLSRKLAADGAVLLKNKNDVLPLEGSKPFALFGRCQIDWFFVGYGSGGTVRAPYKLNLLDALEATDAKFDRELAATYRAWTQKNPKYDGFWGHWPFNYPEMPLSDESIKSVASRMDTAVLVIGRAAGEDRENVLKEGSFYLTKAEKKLLKSVSESFKHTVVLLNIGNIIDLSWIDDYKLDSVLLVWQGGMESGNAVADLLLGKVNPSGRLTDTVAYKYRDYPAADNFGGKDYNFYAEDIYLGYRFFETFKKDAVQFPFGYGLSYTVFSEDCVECKHTDGKTIIKVKVTNTGRRAGKNAVGIYVQKPQGSLGQPVRELAAFSKTAELGKGESQILNFEIDDSELASYDDVGKSGTKNAYILEGGDYIFYMGGSVRDAKEVYKLSLEKSIIKQLTEVSPVQYSFERLTAETDNGSLIPAKEMLKPSKPTLKDEILSQLPDEVSYTGDKGYKLWQVAKGQVTMDDFIAQLNNDELEALSHGDYVMNSPLSVKGNAGVYGGILPSLRDKGIVPVTTTDGPCGIRLEAGCTLLPIGTAAACSWDAPLVEQVYEKIGEEMVSRGTQILLGPGMNIHRNMLCGRNFEYFSEDAVLSGEIAAAMVRGIQSKGVNACPKHFACNNQETNRKNNDSRVSERALREIYLKSFEICVKKSNPRNIMTSYNLINGVWGHYNYHLVTTVLRNEWGFDGTVITDWWMQSSKSPEFPVMRDNAYRVRAQVDVLMPGGKRIVSKKEPDGTLLESLGKENGITLGEMQRGAKNVIAMMLKTPVLRAMVLEQENTSNNATESSN